MNKVLILVTLFAICNAISLDTRILKNIPQKLQGKLNGEQKNKRNALFFVGSGDDRNIFFGNEYYKLAEKLNNAIVFGYNETIAEVLLNSPTTTFNNFHLKRDNQGRAKLDANGKEIFGGNQNLVGYANIMTAVNQIFPLLQTGCQITPFRYFINYRHDTTAKGNPYTTSRIKNTRLCFTGVQAPVINPAIFSLAFIELQYYCLNFAETQNGKPKISEIQSIDIEIEEIDPVVNAAVYATNNPIERCNILRRYYGEHGDKLFHGSQFMSQILRDEPLPNE